MAKGLLFFGGISTEPDVTNLIDTLGVPAPGDQIPYKRIEEILKLRRSDSRWKSVVTAWRRRLERQHNIYLGAVPNEGYEVLDNPARVHLGVKWYKGGLRRIRNSSIVMTKTDRTGLSDEDKRVADHVQRQAASLNLAANTAARELKYPELDKGNEKES